MNTRVAELTVDELKQIIQEAVEQKLAEMLGDPDEGLELREEIKARLRHSLEAERRRTRGIPAQEVAAQLGLEWMPEARDDLASLDKPVAQRILDKLRWLAGHTEHPAPHPARRMAAAAPERNRL